MSKRNLLAAAMVAAAPVIAAPALAAAHPHHHHDHDRGWCGNCGKKQTSARMGEDIDGHHIPGYVFVWADKDNDGVLRGRELRRAVFRVVFQDRSDNDRH